MYYKIILAALCLGLLAACGGQAPTAVPETEVKTEETTADPFPPAAPDTTAADSTKPVTKAEKPNMGPPIIKFETQTFRFDTLAEGEVASFEFKFTNVGERPLEISNVRGSCGCTVGSWPFLLIAKGESGVIKARFDSKGKKGKQESTLTVMSNAESKEMILTLKGFVK